MTSLATKSFRLLRRPRFHSSSSSSSLYKNCTKNKYKVPTTAHYFSTNAAALLDDHDNNETEDYTTTTAPVSPSSSSSSSSPSPPPTNTNRPRLESLRQKLRIENESSTIPPMITKSISATTTTKTNTDSSSASSSSPDLDDILKQLDALPMPDDKQKPLLQDRFGRQHSYLRISLSEKCNLRCLYCMPEDGVPLQPQSHLLSNEEVIRLATWFVHQGVSKVRLTGGEPLLRKDLVSLIRELSEIGNNGNNGLEQIGMTTNGVTLSKHLPDLVDAGLSHVNISLDSLHADKFARLTRRPPSYHARVLQAIEDCATLLPHRTKINCVVMPDNVDELEAFCELTQQMPIDVRFIEYMPFNDNQWGTNEFVSYQDMQDTLQGRLQRIEDGPNDTTKWWRLLSKLKSNDATTTTTIDDDDDASSSSNSSALGRIGFITSMSEHFCGTCNRLRITADGQLKVCLFGKTEVSLRDLMRRNDGSGGSEEDEALQKLIHYAVQRKHFKLGGHKDMEDLQAHSNENRPMTLIGG